MNHVQDALIRTIAFHAAWDHAPTLGELLYGLDTGPDYKDFSQAHAVHELETLVLADVLSIKNGLYSFASDMPHILQSMCERDILQPRKRREARHAASLLARMSDIKFVALANTTALGNARDGGDLDLFIITRHGRIWTTRLLTAGPLKLLGKLPTSEEKPDSVCLSYFISDQGLDLTSHQLNGDDPYFRYWFLSLLPLFDDGIGAELWNQNMQIIRRHPFATPWNVSPDLHIQQPKIRFGLGEYIESYAESFQCSWFPSVIQEKQNKTSEVLVSDYALKFHVDDRRMFFREKYEKKCAEYGVQS